MPRARPNTDFDWQTAAAYEEEGSGCFSGYLLPPLAVLLVSGLLTAFALHTNVRAESLPTASPALPTFLSRTPDVAVTLPSATADSLTTESSPADITPSPSALPQASATADPTPTPADQLAATATADPSPTSPLLIVELVSEAEPSLVPTAISLPASPSNPTELSPIFRPEVQHWAGSIIRWAAEAGLDPNLAAVVMQIESCGDPRALSRSGAIGLFQVMPFHFLATDEPYDPDTNAARGLAYLARSLAAAGGDARLALAGYNGGIGVIARPEWAWSDQTRRYVELGVPMYAASIQGEASTADVEHWHARYATSLCRQAASRLGLP